LDSELDSGPEIAESAAPRSPMKTTDVQGKVKWRGWESNPRHHDFQSQASPGLETPPSLARIGFAKPDPGIPPLETIQHVARLRYPQILEVSGGFGRRDRVSSPKQGGGALSAQTVNPIRRATNEVPTRIRGRLLARRQAAAPRAVDHHSRHRPELQRSEPWPEAAPCIAQ
jgi:hypothetical protein